jgi:hypothetical protein
VSSNSEQGYLLLGVYATDDGAVQKVQVLLFAIRHSRWSYKEYPLDSGEEIVSGNIRFQPLRDLSGSCFYVLVTDDKGLMVNTPNVPSPSTENLIPFP